jgi:ribosomal protein L37AE/L43A
MSASERAAPLYCPYCGDEDLRPHEETHGAWECRSCARVFSLKLLGLSTNALSTSALTKTEVQR